MPCASYHSIMNHACKSAMMNVSTPKCRRLNKSLRNQGWSRANGPIDRMIVSMKKAQVPNARMRTSTAAARSFGGSIR